MLTFPRPFLLLSLTCVLGLVVSCDKEPEAPAPSPPKEKEKENVNKVSDEDLRRAGRDPVLEEIYAYRMKVRPFYNIRNFDKLESLAAEARKGKEVFGNGTRRIAEFYESLACRDDENERMWLLHDQIHREWIKAKPASVTARGLCGFPDELRVARTRHGLCGPGESGGLAKVQRTAGQGG